MAMVDLVDRRAPMPAAPMKYRSDGAVDWGQMWDTFCALAQEGGPPHRGSMLWAQEDADVNAPAYAVAVAEVVRGIGEVSGLTAAAATPGWIGVQCQSAAMAAWLAEAVVAENVQARAEGATLFVPVGDYFTLKGEIKNVITAVAKTTHYWGEHVPAEVKQALWLQTTLKEWQQRLRRRFRRNLGVGNTPLQK